MNIQKTLIITIGILFFSFPVFSQDKVKWYTIEDAEKKLAESPRTLFIDTYTDWCGWCKKMDQDTFDHPVIAKMLNNNFYPVKFNAESKDAITFLGQTFINDGSSGKAHQLAIALLQGRLSFPTIVFLIPEKGKLSALPVPGYKSPHDMEILLSFISEKAYLNHTFEEFMTSFKSSIP